MLVSQKSASKGGPFAAWSRPPLRAWEAQCFRREQLGAVAELHALACLPFTQKLVFSMCKLTRTSAAGSTSGHETPRQNPALPLTSRAVRNANERGGQKYLCKPLLHVPNVLSTNEAPCFPRGPGTLLLRPFTPSCISLTPHRGGWCQGPRQRDRYCGLGVCLPTIYLNASSSLRLRCPV